MSKIKAWLVLPDGEPQDIDVNMGEHILGPILGPAVIFGGLLP